MTLRWPSHGAFLFPNDNICLSRLALYSLHTSFPPNPLYSLTRNRRQVTFVTSILHRRKVKPGQS